MKVWRGLTEGFNGEVHSGQQNKGYTENNIEIFQNYNICTKQYESIAYSLREREGWMTRYRGTQNSPNLHLSLQCPYQ
jgi:hypothetical protein